MRHVQDTIVENVQKTIQALLSDKLTQDEIESLNEELEVKILAGFFEHGITSNPKSYRL